MRNVLRTALVCAAGLLLAGCLEMTNKTTLNPDGSGKSLIDMQTSMGPMAGAMGGGPNAKGPDLKAMAKQTAASTIQRSKGVDAWSDVSYEVTPDNKVHFKGTAYFSDITKFSAGDNMQNDVTWAKEAGGMVLTLKQKDRGGPASQPAPISDEEAAKRVDEAKKQYQQSKPMAAMMLANMKIDMSFVLPGTVSKTNIFKKIDANTVQLLIEGKKMLDAIDAMMTDDKALLASAKTGKKVGPEGSSDQLMEKLFGAKGDMEAHVAGDLKPLFDYKAEMEKAKAAMPEMLKKLEIDPTAPAAPAGFGGPGGPAPK